MDQVRNRLVNFRVTDEEFRRLKAASTLQNARCLSEFARSVVLRTAGKESPSGATGVEDKLVAFDRRLAVLEGHMAALVDALKSSKPQTMKSES